MKRVEETPLPELNFDPQQLHQVLLNLFKNALEAMPRGGELTVTTRVRGEHAEILVADTGEGMTPEVAANVFQPYFTTKTKGTGLGLAISQGIIQEHGGAISVKSAPGQGTAFTIRLPLEPAASPAPPAGAEPPTISKQSFSVAWPIRPEPPLPIEGRGMG